MVPRRGSREGSTESVGAWADASWIPVSAAITIPIPTLKPLDLVIAIVLGSQSGRKPTRLMLRRHQLDAAQCGSSSAGFAAWKQEFAGEARAKGIGASAIQALMATNYAQATINADRGQRSFNLSLDQFLAKRGGPAIVSRGRSLKASQAALFASIQQRY